MPAPSTRWRPACCRWPSARRPRPCPSSPDGRKRYRFTLRWGEARSTDDAEGEVIATSAARPTRSRSRAALPRFDGRRSSRSRRPSRRSRSTGSGPTRWPGRRAQGRAGAADGDASHRFALLERPDADHAVFEVECGKGTYIRSLARDLALALGTVGHRLGLRRTAVGPFTEAQAISLESLETLGDSPAAFGHLFPIETALDDIPALALTAARGRPPALRSAGWVLQPADQIRIGHLERGCMCARDGRRQAGRARGSRRAIFVRCA